MVLNASQLVLQRAGTITGTPVYLYNMGSGGYIIRNDSLVKALACTLFLATTGSIQVVLDISTDGGTTWNSDWAESYTATDFTQNTLQFLIDYSSGPSDAWYRFSVNNNGGTSPTYPTLYVTAVTDY